MPLTTSNILITTSANSPPFRFSFAALHFVRVLNIAKNSALQLLTNFHQVLNKSLTVPWAWGTSCPPNCPTKKWLGVNTGSSRGQLLHTSMVSSLSSLFYFFFSSLQFFVASVSPAFPTVTFRVFLATLTCDSNTPLKWDPSRGFQFHLIPLLGVLSSICTWSLCFKKFSELSLRSYKVCLIITCDFVRSSSGPLVATIRLDAFRKSVPLCLENK